MGRLSSDGVALHHDVAEFHFDNYQRILHISGHTLRSAMFSNHALGVTVSTTTSVAMF